MRRIGHNTKFLVHHTNSSVRNVAMGHERPNYGVGAMSAVIPRATESLCRTKWRSGPEAAVSRRGKIDDYSITSSANNCIA
jgi:hypothetical protein